MPNANTVALVAVVVSGATAIFAPTLSSWGEARRARTRYKQEREATDVGELRALLDETAAAMADILWQLSTVGRERDEERFDELFEHWRALLRLAGRLALRLGADHPVVLDCESATSNLEELVVLLDPHESSLQQLLLSRGEPDVEARILSAYQDFDHAREDFYQAAAHVVGSQIDHDIDGLLTATRSRASRLERLRGRSEGN